MNLRDKIIQLLDPYVLDSESMADSILTLIDRPSHFVVEAECPDRAYDGCSHRGCGTCHGSGTIARHLTREEVEEKFGEALAQAEGQAQVVCKAFGIEKCPCDRGINCEFYNLRHINNHPITRAKEGE